VQLKYAEPLARIESQRLYRLPLAYGDSLAEFDLELNAHGATSPPQPRGGLGCLQFERQQDGYRAHVTQSANNNLLAVPATALYKYGVAQTRLFHDVISGANGGYTAAKGWDYTTGFGSLNVGSFAAFVTSSGGF